MFIMVLLTVINIGCVIGLMYQVDQKRYDLLFITTVLWVASFVMFGVQVSIYTRELYRIDLKALGLL